MSELRCADGHVSTATDYCSVCGLALAGATPPAPSAPPAAGGTASPGGMASPGGTASPGGMACPNCGEPHGPTDVFCESCGLDFASGTLPDPGGDPAVTSISGGAAPAAAGARAGTLTISADRGHYERMDSDGQLAFPDPVPSPLVVPVHGSALIGRAKPARGIHPDIDLAAAPHEDPAVSTRHAVIERRADGTWWLTDLGSTNGTYLGPPDDPAAADPIPADTPVALAPGTPVFVGAWTRIVVTADPVV